MPVPVPAPKLAIATYTSASAISQSIWEALRSRPRESNVILPNAEKALVNEMNGTFPTCKECWISCSTIDLTLSESIDFVLSCTEGAMGSYPIFILSTRPITELNEEFLFPRLSLLVKALRDIVDVSRVYSIFSPEPVTQMFTDLWVELTGVDFVREPYYAATFSYCTKETYIDRPITIPPSLQYDLRAAVESDIPGVAELCFGFAETSEPFVLTREDSIKEATLLVCNKQVWVHDIQKGGEVAEIASIVCTTRQSAEVSAITKVYTNPKWRNLGCAERLVRRVCKHLLKTKESVVLYVAHDNNAAKVYHRVGFVGLAGSGESVKGVEPWLEIGFDRNVVKLGHW